VFPPTCSGRGGRPSASVVLTDGLRRLAFLATSMERYGV
jgi:hypothetical protein